MKTDHQSRKYLNEYEAPDFEIRTTHLVFKLDEHRTRVSSQLAILRRTRDKSAALRLDGVGLNIISISIDKSALSPSQYEVTADQLIIATLPDSFQFSCEVEIDPAANTRLEGLYLSNGNYCTQCEAEGFRHITYYLDRPDVMSVFTTRIEAPKAKLPVLLSNGNLTDSGVQQHSHWVEWHDPYPKPSYLFALVAGDLACIEGKFETMSGRSVDLKIYTEHHNKDKCGHALTSLQKAMKWDEVSFGLEYDLDLYMVVAVDDFNMGAMENKGLNVFNTKYVLANPQTATDNDFLAIEGVIGHEYFHNWTGNRVTCRDWFQLSLKEGLTVFRDQEFSSDMFSRAIQRINDVRILRNHQFAEDAGPMAHPVRPASYQEINNFYTATVYNKGAEVVRMIHSLLGKDNFRKGMDLYFQRHDGQAVTTDDFVAAMQDASGVKLEQFLRWYEQSGTPRIQINRRFDAATQTLDIEITQQPGNTKGQANRAFHMPMRLSLFDQQGRALRLNEAGQYETTVDIRDRVQTLRYREISEKPVISAFRGFSAPIILNTDLEDNELALLMSHDTDAFNRWDASQQYATRVMLAMCDSDPSQWRQLMHMLVESYGYVLADRVADLALLAEMLVLPNEKYIGEMLEQVDVHLIRRVREAIKLEIASRHETTLLNLYQDHQDYGAYSLQPEAVGKRRLKNLCLSYLLMMGKSDYFELCKQQFTSADNMTDQINCLASIVHYRHDIGSYIVESFYTQWQDTALVVDKWFSAQGLSTVDGALEDIKALFGHPAYTLHNPNRARSLLGALISNTVAFHQADGAGYEFVAHKIIELDAINPQIAARLGNAFVHWRKLIPAQSTLMKLQIEKMLNSDSLSNDLNELLTTSLSA